MAEARTEVDKPSGEGGFLQAPSEILPFARAVAEGRARWAGEEPSVSCRREVARVLDVGAEAVLGELDGILVADAAARGLELLRVTGALGVLLPEVAALVGFHATCPVHHKDLWAHSLEVLERTVPEADLRWAALMHDVGKVGTRVVGERGRVSFLRHEPVGAWLMEGVGQRLGMAEGRAGRIAFVIEHHARVNAYERCWSDGAVRRLVRDAGDRLGDLLSFSGADYTTKRRERAAKIRSDLRHLTQRIEALSAADRADAALPRDMGATICEALDLAPGPKVGEHLRWLKARLIAGELPPNAPRELYVEALRARK